MGYRHYIGIIDKEKLEQIKNKIYTKDNYDDFDEYDDYTYGQDFMRQCDIQDNCVYNHCIGKLYYLKTNDVYNALYKDKVDLIGDNDVECFIPQQDILLTLANIYLKMAQSYFEDLFKPFKEELIKRKDIFGNLTDEKKLNFRKILNDINDKIHWFNRTFDKDKKDIAIDDLFEHQAFNLAHLHKTIDFKKQVVVCYAY